jgi:hypothetical protein
MIHRFLYKLILFFSSKDGGKMQKDDTFKNHEEVFIFLQMSVTTI